MRSPGSIIRIALPFALAFLAQSHAHAGMPTPSVILSELTHPRLEAISFFLLCYMICSLIVRAIWNGFRSDFPSLPRLSFAKSMGLVGLWGMVFLLVLTMISGARELMTPGAWEKDGITFKLAAKPKPVDDPHGQKRHESLNRLRILLWNYAENHGGKFPPERSDPTIPVDFWRLPDPTGILYRYEVGKSADVGSTPLAFEPQIFGDDPLVLLTDGRILAMSREDITRSLKQEAH